MNLFESTRALFGSRFLDAIETNPSSPAANVQTVVMKAVFEHFNFVLQNFALFTLESFVQAVQALLPLLTHKPAEASKVCCILSSKVMSVVGS
jgi:hypothetical protein